MSSIMSITDARVTAIVVVMTEAEAPFALAAVQSASMQGADVVVRVYYNAQLDWISGVIDEAKNERTSFIPMERAHAAVVRNRGVREARTDWVAFLDGDDEWCKGKIEAQLRAADATSADLVGVDHLLVSADKRPFCYGLPRNIPMLSTWLVRRDLMLEMPFDETLFRHEDGAWWIQHHGRITALRVPQVLCRYTVRINSKSSTNVTKKRKESLLGLAERWKLRPLLLGLSYVARRATISNHYVRHSKW